MSDSAFWRFSLAFYSRPGVAEACIALQDECGADVNVALYLLFLALDGRVIDANDLTRIIAVAAPWNDAVVLPLRSVRRRMKGGVTDMPASPTEALRTEVKRIELQAERLLQEALEALGLSAQFATRHDSPDMAAKINLEHYAGLLGVDDERLEPLLRRFYEHCERAGRD
jgi:uncharacterized protein (TIGR02444 family)